MRPEQKHKRLLPPEQLATIKFLSEYSSTVFFDCLPELCALGPPPKDSLIAGKLALWPTVLVLECEPSEALRAWHREVNTFLERKGFLIERHPRFQPHISLARKKPEHKLISLEGEGGFLEKQRDHFKDRPVPLTAPLLWRSQAEETGRKHWPLLSPLFKH